MLLLRYFAPGDDPVPVDLSDLGANQIGRQQEARTAVHNLNDYSYIVQYTGRAPVRLTVNGEFTTNPALTSIDRVLGDNPRDLFDTLLSLMGRYVRVSQGSLDFGDAMVVGVNAPHGDIMQGETLTTPWRLDLLFADGAGVNALGTVRRPGTGGEEPPVPTVPRPEPQPQPPAGVRVYRLAPVGLTRLTEVPGRNDIWIRSLGRRGLRVAATMTPLTTAPYTMRYERWGGSDWVAVATQNDLAGVQPTAQPWPARALPGVEWMRAVFVHDGAEHRTRIIGVYQGGLAPEDVALLEPPPNDPVMPRPVGPAPQATLRLGPASATLRLAVGQTRAYLVPAGSTVALVAGVANWYPSLDGEDLSVQFEFWQYSVTTDPDTGRRTFHGTRSWRPLDGGMFDIPAREQKEQAYTLDSEPVGETPVWVRAVWTDGAAGEWVSNYMGFAWGPTAPSNWWPPGEAGV